MKIKTTILVLMSCFIVSGCVGIGAWPYNEEEMCWELEQVEVASEVRIFGGCDQLTVTTKKDGKYWLFPSGCIPNGYTPISGDERPDGNFCEE